MSVLRCSAMFFGIAVKKLWRRAGGRSGWRFAVNAGPSTTWLLTQIWLNTLERILEKNKDDIEYLSEVVTLIDEATLPRIDFDELKARLSKVHDLLAAREELAAEYALLRDDCERRIAGMTKAIAAVDRKRD